MLRSGFQSFLHTASSTRFTRAIVRCPCPNMVHGETTQTQNNKNIIPIYKIALQQHADYVNALKKTGLSVLELPYDNQFPDSCFVEDTAVLTPHCAILTRPGVLVRRDEIIGMKPVLDDLFEHVYSIQAPGTLDGKIHF